MAQQRNALFTPAVNEYQLDELVKIFSDIRDFMGCPPECSFALIEGSGVKITGRITNMELREGQSTTASVKLQTASGNPAAYQQGTETWESSDATVVSVEPDLKNPLSARISGLNGSNNAACVVTFSCDGDPDADQTRDIVATLDVVCTQGEAFVASMETTPPVDTLSPQPKP